MLEDDVVSHAFSHGYHPQHTERLAAYWAEALGGPALYSGKFGDETSVVRIHSGNGLHEEMDLRAIACFDMELDDDAALLAAVVHAAHHSAGRGRHSTAHHTASRRGVTRSRAAPREACTRLRRSTGWRLCRR